MTTTPPVVHYPALKLRRRTSGTLFTPPEVRRVGLLVIPMRMRIQARLSSAPFGLSKTSTCGSKSSTRVCSVGCAGPATKTVLSLTRETPVVSVDPPATTTTTTTLPLNLFIEAEMTKILGFKVSSHILDDDMTACLSQLTALCGIPSP